MKENQQILGATLTSCGHFWYCMSMQRTMSTDVTNLNWSKRAHSISKIFPSHIYSNRKVFEHKIINHMLKRKRPERGNDSEAVWVSRLHVLDSVRPHQVFSWTWREGNGTFKFSSVLWNSHAWKINFTCRKMKQKMSERHTSLKFCYTGGAT